MGLSRRDSQDSLDSPLSGRPSLVVRRGSSRGGGVSSVGAARPQLLVRRLGCRLGGSSARSICGRRLVSSRVSSVYKRKGASCDREGSSLFQIPSSEPVGLGILRQHHSGGSIKKPRRVSVISPQRDFSEDSEVGRVCGSQTLPSVSSRVVQRDRGRPISSQSSSGVRVDIEPERVLGTATEVAFRNRSLCDISKSPLWCLFCSNLGSHGCGRGCHAPVLGPSTRLRVSSIRHHQAGPQQVEVLKGNSADADSSLLVPEGMVPRSSRSSGRTSHSTSSQTEPSLSASLSTIPSKPPHASSSCLETLKREARHAGFSERVASQVVLARRNSTRLGYQCRWEVYRKWCSSKGHSVSNPSIPKVADFLLWLWQHKRLSLSSVKTYRSVLSAVFKFRLPEISDHPIINSLFRSFAIARPRSSSSFPSWDLDKVLKYLISLEPIRSLSFRDLSRKTLFLVSLATAKRVGELQALSSLVPWLGKDLSLSYRQEFLAKTESAVNPLPRSFLLKSLRDFAGDLEEGRYLCPVRCLSCYLSRSAAFVPRCSSLFVSPKRPSRGISKNAISFFLRDVISSAGASSQDKTPRAHSIRGMATSFSFVRNASISKVLEAASWRSNSVFSSFYLKDVAYSLGECRSLGPFIAAGAVIS